MNGHQPTSPSPQQAPPPIPTTTTSLPSSQMHQQQQQPYANHMSQNYPYQSPPPQQQWQAQHPQTNMPTPNSYMYPQQQQQQAAAHPSYPHQHQQQQYPPYLQQRPPQQLYTNQQQQQPFPSQQQQSYATINYSAAYSSQQQQEQQQQQYQNSSPGWNPGSSQSNSSMHPTTFVTGRYNSTLPTSNMIAAATLPGSNSTFGHTPAAATTASIVANNNNHHRHQFANRRPPYIDPDTKMVYDVNDPDYEGWLSKQSQWLKEWRKRYFILKGSKLFFCKHPTSGAPHGMMDLSICTTVKSADLKSGKLHSFEISTPDTCYLLFAESESEKDDWIGRVGKAIVRCSRTYYKGESNDNISSTNNNQYSNNNNGNQQQQDDDDDIYENDDPDSPYFND